MAAEPEIGQIENLRACINDLISILAFPAIWSRRQPVQIVGTLLEALLGMLRLDFVYARLTDPIEGGPVELTRFAQPPSLKLPQREIVQLLRNWMGNDPRKFPSQARHCAGDEEFSLVGLRLGLQGEIGVIVAGSRRSDFPGETESLVLNVAGNQAVIGLQEARELSAQKRITNELDHIVTQRTKELATLVDNIPGLIAVMAPDGTVEFINERVREYFGRTLEELKAWSMTDAVHPDDRTCTVATWRSSIETGQPYELDHRLRRFDGAYRWFHAAGLPIQDADGRIVRWYVLLTDIDRRRTAEEKLRRDERELRKITDAIPVLVTALSPDGQTLYVNQAVLDYTGLTRDDAIERDFRRLVFHPEDVEKLGVRRSAALARGVPFENEQRARRKDGQYRWMLIRYHPLRDESGDIMRWYATGTDIHDRKQAEERTSNENLALREEVNRSSMFEEIVGSSPALHKVLVQVAKVAPTDSTVLISGETGTGKELVARAIHKRSNRATHAFVSVNCGAIPPSLIASELFGHEKGAFTGAVQRRAGRFEAADGGTIFLDEVGDLPVEMQVALLRVLQEREFERIGSTEPLKVDVRVLAATNRDLRRAVSNGSFRQDLFYRLNVFPIEVPPLRDRASDIPLLVRYLIERYSKKAGRSFKEIGKSTLDLFQTYAWPGNVRELQNVVERAVVLCESDVFSIEETWLKRESTPESTPVVTLAPLANSERELIEAALAESRGRISGASGAAAKLRIPRQTLESKILRLGINKQRFKN
jgi:formate hydrogenlyase transcriptional activator